MQLDKLDNQQLIALYRETGNEEIKEFFFKKNENYFLDKAHKWNRKLRGFASWEEIYSIALYGGVKSFNRFKLDVGTVYITLADITIDNEIKMLLRTLNRAKNKGIVISSLEKVTVEGDTGSNSDKNMHSVLADDSHFAFDDIVENEALSDIIHAFYYDIKKNKRASKKMIPVFEKTFYEGKIQLEISQELGISQSYVSRIQKTIRHLLIGYAKEMEVV